MVGHYLKKWYFDIQTAENEYIFFYCAFARLLGFNIRAFHLNFSRLGNERIISKSLSIPFPQNLSAKNEPPILHLACGRIEFDRSTVAIHIKSIAIDCDLTYTLPITESFTPLIIPVTAKNKIFWHPLSLNSQVSGSMKIENENIVVHGAIGYIDYLFSTVFPLQVPVHILLWGRIHHAKIDIAYTIAIGAPSERRWCKMYVRTKSSVYEIDNLALIINEIGTSEQLQINYPAGYEIQGKINDVNIGICVKHLQEAAISTFVDDQEMRHGLQGHLIRYFSRNPRGIKFFSRANVKIESMEVRETIDDIIFIDEFVEFRV